MLRRRFLVGIGLSTTTTVAGCSSSDGEPTENPDESGGSGDTTDDESDGRDGTGSDDRTEEAGGSGPTGETVDGDELFDAHTTALQGSASFEAEQRIDMTRNGEYAGAEEKAIVYEVGEDRGYEDVTLYSGDGPFMAFERYADGDTAYINEEGEDPKTDHVGAEVDPDPYMIPEYTVEFEAFRPGTAGIAFEKTGTTTHDGDKVTRYEATGDAEAVATVDATLFVADSGVVRYVEMDATYGETDNDVTMEITAETTAVDDATVEPPEWVPEDG